jgi:hypothetical protein
MINGTRRIHIHSHHRINQIGGPTNTVEDIPVFNMMGAINKHIHFTFYYHEVQQEVLPHGFK